MTGGRGFGQSVTKASRGGGGGGKDFLKPTKCDFDIFSFFFFYESPMNLVALVKDFQN